MQKKLGKSKLVKDDIHQNVAFNGNTKLFVINRCFQIFSENNMAKKTVNFEASREMFVWKNQLFL